MNQFLKNSNRLRITLISYWIMIPLMYIIYLFILADKQSVKLIDLFQTIPSTAITLLLICMLLLQAAALYCLKIFPESSRKSLLGIYSLFSIFQQLFTINLPGAILSGLLFFSLPDRASCLDKEKISSGRIKLYAFLGFISLLTLLLLFVRYRLSLQK